MVLLIKKRRLIKYGIFVMKYIKIKYCFILLIIFIMYQLFNSTELFKKYLQSMAQKNSSVHLKYLVVHFDLKGMPPKLSYLSNLAVSLKVYGVNAILMEYEDMFPYEGRLVNLSARNCYHKAELKKFLNVIHSSGMEVIPLVQTFGHMEFVLKLKEFMHLREKPIHPSSICPSKSESIALIEEMLNQSAVEYVYGARWNYPIQLPLLSHLCRTDDLIKVIQFHNSVAPLNHIHIGCDEVFNMNDCHQCRQRNMENIMLFLNHVKTVDGIVKKLSPNTKVLIWNDMLLKKYNRALHSTRINLSNIEPVYWDYRPTFSISHKHLYEHHKAFSNIWVASAFKGAESDDAVLPNLTTRFLNNRQWLEHIIDYKFGGENKVYHFKGMILTGWSRRTHLAPPFELLISAIPSLILNLLLIKAVMEGVCLSELRYMNKCDLFDKYVSPQFYTVFAFNNHFKDNMTECSFEGNRFHAMINKYFNVDYKSQLRKRIKYLEYNYEIRNIDMFDVEYGIQTCNMEVEKLLKRSVYIRAYMDPYYNEDFVDEYISYKIGVHITKLRNIKSILQNYSLIRYWERRPYGLNNND